ncbi:hypothetical protein ABH942_000049 [Flavobacterium sp. 28YEA47A]|uniref:hypothetical protein n=1 Tax=Flavobacterium sp. 28YEA47A TaxID=3156276 RepID=UPI003514DD50
MNAIVEKIKNRSYFQEVGIVNSENSETEAAELEREKTTLLLTKKRQRKTAIEQYIDDEIKLMSDHIRKKGRNTYTAELLTDDLKLSQKMEWHEQLQKSIVPATLKSVKYAALFYDDFSSKKKFFRLPIARYFFCFIVFMVIAVAVGFCTKETRLFTGYYSFELTDTAVFYFIKSYGIATACLGNLLYLAVKLSKQIRDVTLTSARISFYRNCLLLGIFASSFFALKIPELFLTDLTFINNLFIGIIIGFIVDILNTIFRQ